MVTSVKHKHGNKATFLLHAYPAPEAGRPGQTVFASAAYREAIAERPGNLEVGENPTGGVRTEKGYGVSY